MFTSYLLTLFSCRLVMGTYCPVNLGFFFTYNSCKVAESMRLNLHSDVAQLKNKNKYNKSKPMDIFFTMIYLHVWSVQLYQNDTATYNSYLSAFSPLAFSAPLLTRQVNCSADHIKHNTFRVCQRSSTHKNTMTNIKWYYLRLASTILSRGVVKEHLKSLQPQTCFDKSGM